MHATAVAALGPLGVGIDVPQLGRRYSFLPITLVQVGLAFLHPLIDGADPGLIGFGLDLFDYRIA
jgi:hypothetical protein